MQYFHAYHAWLMTISQYLVSTKYLVLSYLSVVLNLWYIATTVDVEHVFSHGCLILPHVRSCLAVESMHVSICVGLWSSQGLVLDNDITASLDTYECGEECELPDDWDAVHAL